MAIQSNLRNARNTGLRNIRDYSPTQTAKPVACEVYSWTAASVDGEANTLVCYSLNMDLFVDADRKKYSEGTNVYSGSAYRFARDGFYTAIEVFTTYKPNMDAGTPGDIATRNRDIVMVEERQANNGSICYTLSNDIGSTFSAEYITIDPTEVTVSYPDKIRIVGVVSDPYKTGYDDDVNRSGLIIDLAHTIDSDKTLIDGVGDVEHYSYMSNDPPSYSDTAWYFGSPHMWGTDMRGWYGLLTWPQGYDLDGNLIDDYAGYPAPKFHHMQIAVPQTDRFGHLLTRQTMYDGAYEHARAEAWVQDNVIMNVYTGNDYSFGSGPQPIIATRYDGAGGFNICNVTVNNGIVSSVSAGAALASGTFTTADGKTVTVVGGLITSIV